MGELISKGTPISFYVVFLYTPDDTMGWKRSRQMIPIIGVARIEDRTTLNVLYEIIVRK